MPFRGFQRYSFSRSSIRQNAPASPGVYGIANADEWILIGAADDLRAALLSHLNAAGTALLARLPKGFVFELCAPGTQRERLARLTMELKPCCNPG